MGPLSPSKLGLPLSTLDDDEEYAIISGEGSPVRSTTLPPDGRKKLFTTRSPSPTSAKKSEKKGGFLRKRSGSFDSHAMLTTRKN